MIDKNLQPQKPLREIDVTLHLHLHHPHPDQGAPGQAIQQGDLVLLLLNVILDFLKEEFLGVEDRTILVLSGAVWTQTVQCNCYSSLIFTDGSQTSPQPQCGLQVGPPIPGGG